MFGRANWEPARAVIVLVHIKRVSSDGLTLTREWAADVTRSDGSVVRAQIDEPRWVTDFWPPDAGDRVLVLVNSRNGKVRFDMTDPQLSLKGRDKAERDAFRAALGE
ncbi:MAG: hypothetical protein ACOH19_16395 [Rhodoglobus sp.]